MIDTSCQAKKCCEASDNAVILEKPKPNDQRNVLKDFKKIRRYRCPQKKIDKLFEDVFDPTFVHPDVEDLDRFFALNPNQDEKTKKTSQNQRSIKLKTE